MEWLLCVTLQSLQATLMKKEKFGIFFRRLHSMSFFMKANWSARVCVCVCGNEPEIRNGRAIYATLWNQKTTQKSRRDEQTTAEWTPLRKSNPTIAPHKAGINCTVSHVQHCWGNPFSCLQIALSIFVHNFLIWGWHLLVIVSKERQELTSHSRRKCPAFAARFQIWLFCALQKNICLLLSRQENECKNQQVCEIVPLWFLTKHTSQFLSVKNEIQKQFKLLNLERFVPWAWSLEHDTFVTSCD